MAHAVLEGVQRSSLKSAAREQKLSSLVCRLQVLVPDLSDQYTTFRLDSKMLELKARTQHAFQVKLALKAVNCIIEKEMSAAVRGRPLTIIDVGDSAGTHTLYLKELLTAEKKLAGREIEFLSVNLDPRAVEKIRAKGLRAVLCTAQEIREKEEIDADLFVCFEILEHLNDPVSFLDGLSRQSECKYLVATVPYVKSSRMGLHHIRHGLHHSVTSENTHIFELSPDDWKLVFLHTGWEVVQEEVYRQYPRRSLWRVTRPVWRRFDFEGFYGVILSRNRTWAECSRSL